MKISSGVAVRDEGSTAGRETLVGEPKFPPLSKCVMKPTNIHSDWMSNTFSGLCIKLHHINPLFSILGSNTYKTLCCFRVSTLDTSVQQK